MLNLLYKIASKFYTTSDKKVMKEIVLMTILCFITGICCYLAMVKFIIQITK